MAKKVDLKNMNLKDVDLKETFEEVQAKVKEAAEKAEPAAQKAKAAAKKTADDAKKTAEEARKAVEKAVEKAVAPKPAFIIQYGASEISLEKVQEAAKAAFIAEGHRASTIKDIRIYVKPEDNAAYYVVNDKYSGKVDLF